MSEPVIEVKHLSKTFGTNQVLKDIDFTVSQGDVISVIGPSGSGKSTMLRCITFSKPRQEETFSITAKA